MLSISRKYFPPVPPHAFKPKSPHQLAFLTNHVEYCSKEMQGRPFPPLVSPGQLPLRAGSLLVSRHCGEVRAGETS